MSLHSYLTFWSRVHLEELIPGRETTAYYGNTEASQKPGTKPYCRTA